MKGPKLPGEKTVRMLLEKHGCPVPFHEVRTRFLGNIATPALSVSPLQVVKALVGRRTAGLRGHRRGERAHRRAGSGTLERLHPASEAAAIPSG